MKATTFAGPALLAAIVISISAALLFAQVPTLQPAEPDQPAAATPTAPPIVPAPAQPVRPRAAVTPGPVIDSMQAPALGSATSRPSINESKPPVQLKIYKLKYADAASLASVISQSIDAKGPMRVVPDSRTNQLVISASQPDSEMLESLIQQLDVPGEDAKPGLDQNRLSGRRSATGGASSSGGSSDPIRSWATSKLNEYDVNDNGKLERVEWRNLSNGQRYDQDGDGIITLEELIEGQKNWRPGEASGSTTSSTKPRAVGGAVGGGGRGGFSAGGFDGGASFGSGGGFQGAFGAAGEGGGFGSGGFAPNAATAVDSAELTKALREADATAKQADLQTKQMAEVLKQIESSTNKTDESAKLHARLRELLEHQRQASEKQRRAVENANRAAEAAGRNAATIFKLEPEAARGDLAYQKLQLDAALARAAQYQESVKAAEARGMTAEAERLRTVYERMQENVASLTAQLQKSAAATSQNKELPKKLAESNAQLIKQLGEYKKLIAGKPGDEQKAKAAGVKEELGLLLNKQFEERQKAHSDELRQMRERLEKLEKEMSDRTKNRSEIINRRLEELLAAKSANAILTIQESSLDAVGALPKILKLPGNTTGVRRTRTLEDGTVVIEEQIRQQPDSLKVAPNDNPFGAETPNELKLDSNDDPFGNSTPDVPKPAPDDDPFR